MDKTFSILSALSIILATIGLLLIPQIWDRRIKAITEENTNAISKQKNIVELLEKANSCAATAMMTSDSIEILKAVKAREDITRKREDRYLFHQRSSAMYVLNALLASGQIDGQAGEDLKRKIDSMKIDDLRNFCITDMKKAGAATIELQKKIDENNRKIRHLESRRNLVWKACFAFQSFGMLLGLGALFIKR